MLLSERKRVGVMLESSEIGFNERLFIFELMNCDALVSITRSSLNEKTY